MKKFLLVPAILFITCHLLWAQEKEELIKDPTLKNEIVKVVEDDVNASVKKNGFLLAEVEGKKKAFILVQVFDTVSRKGDVYTVQVDVDQIGGEKMLLLFYDVKKESKTYYISGIRQGPKHLRQTSSYTPPVPNKAPAKTPVTIIKKETNN